MKARTYVIAAALLATTALGGCDRIKGLFRSDSPSGQVVATVNGKEITAIELRQELGGFASRDPAVMKQAQSRAIETIAVRKLMVEKAKTDKLDKSADYTLQVLRGEEGLLLQLYQRKIAASVAVPSRQEALDFIGANPSRFAARKVLVVDQVIAGPNKIEPAKFQPLKSLEEVKGLLGSENVQYQSNVSTLDTLGMDPRMLEQIEKLPAGEVFVVPQRGSLLFNRIIDQRAVPFTGEAAVAYAINVVRNQKVQEAVGRQVELLRKEAAKVTTYNDAYKPAPVPASKGPPAAASK